MAIVEVRLENSDYVDSIANYFLMPKKYIITLRILNQIMPGVEAFSYLSFKVVVSLPNYLYTH